MLKFMKYGRLNTDMKRQIFNETRKCFLFPAFEQGKSNGLIGYLLLEIDLNRDYYNNAF